MGTAALLMFLSPPPPIPLLSLQKCAVKTAPSTKNPRLVVVPVQTPPGSVSSRAPVRTSVSLKSAAVVWAI